RLSLEHVLIGLADQFAGYRHMIEAIADALRDRALERVVIEDRRENETRKRRLARGNFCGFITNARPDRIDDLKSTRDFRLTLGHGPLLRHLRRFLARSGLTRKTGF